MSLSWARVDQRGISLNIRVQPNASANAYAGTWNECLKIRLNSPARDNKANKALQAFLAESFHVPKSRVTIIRGHQARNKELLISDLGNDELKTFQKLIDA